ncbi:hypothetical protein OS493_030504 [Desmophyllum pertusum]|uniref:Uncharacterized protein n=1 Tax=Desmophyllum pertusum TaxID=174260 RepID=A0A9W9YN35_9CNID|nr:hypothetical protein OS493_030504 [Desmophyllum pertusum]
MTGFSRKCLPQYFKAVSESTTVNGINSRPVFQSCSYSTRILQRTRQRQEPRQGHCSVEEKWEWRCLPCFGSSMFYVTCLFLFFLQSVSPKNLNRVEDTVFGGEENPLKQCGSQEECEILAKKYRVGRSSEAELDKRGLTGAKS